MQIVLAIALAVTAYLLFSSRQKFDNKDLERAANVGGIVATAAAIIVLAFYTFPSGTSQTEQPTVEPNTVLTQINPTVAIIDTSTPSLIPSDTPEPTETLSPYSAPVIDSIEFPTSIVCDARKYDVPIRFHDLDGDAHRITWQLIYSKKETTLYTDAKEFYIDSQKQINGAVYEDFVEWHVAGDEVTIRVFIEDRTELTGYMDFGFKCSN